MFDGELMFSRGQSVSGSSDSVNILHVERDIGAGTPMYLEFVTPPVTGTGSVKVTIMHGNLENMSDATTHVEYTIDNEMLRRGGAVFCGPIPPWTKKYLRAKYDVSGAVTGLKVTSGITTSAQTAYPQGRRN